MAAGLADGEDFAVDARFVLEDRALAAACWRRVKPGSAAH
jgi:hypothetical protein